MKTVQKLRDTMKKTHGWIDTNENVDELDI